jgi:hypothetical protein
MLVAGYSFQLVLIELLALIMLHDLNQTPSFVKSDPMEGMQVSLEMIRYISIFQQ